MASPKICFFDDEAARRNRRQEMLPAGYARLSFDEDGQNFCSIQNQVDIINKYCQDRLNTRPVDIYVDDGVSGYSFERDSFSRLASAIELGRCNLIVAKDLSRIGRHNALTQLFVEECERCGIRVVAIEDYDSFNPSDELTLGIRTWSNERAVKDASRKVQAVVDHKQKSGTWFCAAPYGYTVLSYEEGAVAVDPQAAAVVRQIYQMYDSGMGYKAICVRLTAQHVPTPSQHYQAKALEAGKKYNKKVGDAWRVSTVVSMLADDFYTGTLRTNKYDRMGINGKDVRTPKEQQHVFPNHHPPIIGQELFDRVQARREDKKRTNDRGVRKFPNIYSGHIRCGDCGFPMYAMQRPNLAPQYVCGKWFSYGKAFCTTHTVKTAVLDKIVLDYLSLIRERGGALLEALNADVRRLAAGAAASEGPRPQELAKELEQIRAEIQAIESQRVKQILRSPEREELINSTYDQLLQDALCRKEAAESRLQSAADAQHAVKSTAKRLHTAMDVISHIIDTGSLTRGDIAALLDTITVYQDGRIAIKLNADLSALELGGGPVSDKPRNNKERRYRVVADTSAPPGGPLSMISPTGLPPEYAAFA